MGTKFFQTQLFIERDLFAIKNGIKPSFHASCFYDQLYGNAILSVIPAFLVETLAIFAKLRAPVTQTELEPGSASRLAIASQFLRRRSG